MCDLTGEQAQGTVCLELVPLLLLPVNQMPDRQQMVRLSCAEPTERKMCDLPCNSPLQPAADEACFQTPECSFNGSRSYILYHFLLCQAEAPIYGLESIKAYVAAWFTAPIKIGCS